MPKKHLKFTNAFLLKNNTIIMPNILKNIKWFLIGIVVLVSGCSISPLSRYPDFPEKKKEITSTFILSDFVLMEAVAGDTVKIDVPETKRYAKACMDYFAGKLNEKELHVDRAVLSSVGLLMDRNKKNPVIRSVEDKQSDVSQLYMEYPPYFEHEVFSRDTILSQLLRIVYSSLLGYEKSKDETSQNIPAAVHLGKAFGSRIMAVVFGIGYDSPVSYRAAVERASPKNKYETISFDPVTQFTIMFYLIDVETGDIIWDDRAFMQGGTINMNKLTGMVDKIVAELP